MKIFCRVCRKEMLDIPSFIPNLDLNAFLVLFRCPYCEDSRVVEININKKE